MSNETLLEQPAPHFQPVLKSSTDVVYGVCTLENGVPAQWIGEDDLELQPDVDEAKFFESEDNAKTFIHFIVFDVPGLVIRKVRFTTLVFDEGAP